MNLDKLSHSEKIKLLKLLQASTEKSKYAGIRAMTSIKEAFINYPKTLEFFEAGSQFRERVIAGANQSGKSYAQYTEIALHATGLYPDDWTGRRFSGDILIWCASVDQKAIMRVGQTYLMGPMYDIGSGMLPKDTILDWKSQPGTPNGVSSISVKRYDGSRALIEFKSYEAGRKTFQGSRVHVVGLDEEPTGAEGTDIYMEALTRTATTDGMVLLTFTPLEGLTETVLRLLPGGRFPADHRNPKLPSVWVTQITWDDAAHLTNEAKTDLLSSFSDHMKEARSMGIPMVGAGKVYQILERDFIIEPFTIPEWFPRCYAVDPGVSAQTAVVWGAIDPGTDTLYLYDEYYNSSPYVDIHVNAIKRRGAWIRGVIDPASLGKGMGDTRAIIQQYRDAGLDVIPANNAVELGILEIQQALSQGKIKVFKTLSNWISEYRIYARDKDGNVKKKQADHLLDATRYLKLSAVRRADTQISEDTQHTFSFYDHDRNDRTGY